MVEAVVSSALNTIGELVTEEAKFLYGVKDEVEALQAELRRMLCFLEDAESAKYRDKRVANWIAEIRELAYRSESVVETYTLKVASKRKSRGSFKVILRRFICILKEGTSIHQIGSEVQTIRKNIANLSSSLQTYGIRELRRYEDSSNQGENIQLLRRTYSHVIEDDFVGLDKDITILVGALVNYGNNFRTVFICGMGGLGKTTLAKKTYHHTTVRHHFDAFAWTCISQQWKKEVIIREILISLNPEKKGEVREMGDHELVKQLFEIQVRRKCLIVLDDVWSEDVWNIIKCAFPDKGTGSIVIITTRLKEVTTRIDPLGFLHEPRFLDDEESWELMQKKAFPTGKIPDFITDAKTQGLGRQIAKECGGLPLAIVVLGGLLAKKQSLSEWGNVHKNIASYRKGDKGDGRLLMEILGLSYQELPYHLKACFLYLASYPEDHEIVAEKLYLKWKAEGIISKSLQDEEKREEESLIDVAQACLSELAQRYMVQIELEPKYETSIGTAPAIKFCRLHDTMRDLCLLKAKEENFFHVFNCRQSHGLVSIYRDGENRPKVHRLAIYFPDNDNGSHLRPIEREESTQDIRTIIFFNFHHHFGKQLARIFTNFKLVRTLDFQGLGYRVDACTRVLPKEIGNLILLTYLSLAGTYFKRLPSSICKLRYLQTLDLQTSCEIYVPNVLWKLKELTHLYLPYKYAPSCKGKLRLDGLNKLEKLKNLTADEVDIKGLFTLPKLRRLEVVEVREKIEDLAVLTNYLLSNNQLSSANITVSHIDFTTEEASDLLSQLLRSDAIVRLTILGFEGKFPGYRSEFRSNLTTLELYSTRNRKGDLMVALGTLPNLSRLHLFGGSLGQRILCGPQSFPLLENLAFASIDDLEELILIEGAMPNLSTLNIWKCSRLGMIPHGLKLLPNLRELFITDMPKEFKERVQVVDGIEGPDFHQVRHIPTIYIKDL